MGHFPTVVTLKLVIKILVFSLLLNLLKLNLSCQSLDSKGKIFNSGTIVIKGNANFSQDTIKGTIVFNQNSIGFNQYIPHKTYQNILLKGGSHKIFNDTLFDFYALDYFYSDSVSIIKIFPNSEINILSIIEHNGVVNPNYNYGKVLLNGISAQSIYGRGLFRELALKNKFGVDVINNGGFTVDNRLELAKDRKSVV